MDQPVLNPVLICLVVTFALVFLYLQWGWYLHAGATFEEEDCTSDHDDMSPAVEREELLLSGVLAKTRTTSEEACSICLGVLVAGEKERLLPRCRHSFHPHCIDQWFHFRKLPSKLTCPLCRTPTP